MPAITFEEQELAAMVPDPADGGTFKPVRLRWRRDPLTDSSTRILTGVKLQPPSRPDLTELTGPPAFCPFDADKLEEVTFPFPPELTIEGRIRCGKAVVVPNLLAYANHSAVGIFDPAKHFLDLDELTGPIIGDTLAALVRHARAVRRLDPTSAWSSINANYLPPSGASLVHPHIQSAHDTCGTTAQRMLVARSAAWPGANSYWEALVDAECEGPRWIGRVGRVAWLTPFAPSGFHEVWAVVDDCHDITELTEDDTASLGQGLSRILAAYKRVNLTSFNFALIGGGPDAANSRYHVVLKVMSRSNAEPMYRSDATYFERVHWEAMIDLSPEEVAELVRADPSGALA